MLCSQSDIEALRQVDITDEPDVTITALIRHAEGILEGATGRRFDPVAAEVLRIEDADWVDGAVYLPHYPVDSVVVKDADGVALPADQFVIRPFGTVTNMGVGTGSYTWDWQYNVGSGTRAAPWPAGYTLEVTGGITDPDDTPQDLRTLCAQIAADLFDAGLAASQGGNVLQSESLGGWSVAFRSAAAQYELSSIQKKIVRKYSHKRPVVAI